MRCDEYHVSWYSNIFEKEADEYHEAHLPKVKKAVKLFDVHENGKILDIGCCDGFFAKLIEEKTKAKMFGLDISKASVEKAVKRGVEAKTMDIDGARLPFENGFFDAVFCGDTIEHIFDTENLVEEVFRILKPNGYFMLTIPNVNAWYNRFLTFFGYLPAWIEPTAGKYKGTPFFKNGFGHVRAFNKRVIKHFLKEKGFEIEKMKGSHVLANKEYGVLGRTVWNAVDSSIAKFAGLSTFIIVKARKPK